MHNIMSKYEIGNELIRGDHLPDNSFGFLFVILFIKYYIHAIIYLKQ